MSQQNNFKKTVLLLTAILLVGIYTINNFGVLVLPKVLYFVVIAIAIFTYFAYQYLQKSSTKMFVNSFMGIMGVKMFASLIFLAIYLYINPAQKYEVAFGLFVIYIAFNILLFSAIKRINPKKDTVS